MAIEDVVLHDGYNTKAREAYRDVAILTVKPAKGKFSWQIKALIILIFFTNWRVCVLFFTVLIQNTKNYSRATMEAIGKRNPYQQSNDMAIPRHTINITQWGPREQDTRERFYKVLDFQSEEKWWNRKTSEISARWFIGIWKLVPKPQRFRWLVHPQEYQVGFPPYGRNF